MSNERFPTGPEFILPKSCRWGDAPSRGTAASRVGTIRTALAVAHRLVELLDRIGGVQSLAIGFGEDLHGGNIAATAAMRRDGGGSAMLELGALRLDAARGGDSRQPHTTRELKRSTHRRSHNRSRSGHCGRGRWSVRSAQRAARSTGVGAPRTSRCRRSRPRLDRRRTGSTAAAPSPRPQCPSPRPRPRSCGNGSRSRHVRR